VRLIVPLFGILLLAGCLGGQQDAAIYQTADNVVPEGGNGLDANEVVQMGSMRLTSSAFQEGGMIPVKYACDGQDMNPPLRFEGVPVEAKSLALIVDDPDAPSGDWVHWVLWDIDPKTKEIRENSSAGTEGTTSFRRAGYGGPCPPSGTHRYFFKAYALDEKVNLPTSAGKRELLDAVEGHILAKSQLMGKYSKG
jgi:Raf kinase inhibitor-like YbhB/YbcL family protein